MPVVASRIGLSGRTLIWNLGLDQGELPLRTAFPILLSNATQWFQGNTAPWQEAYPTGSFITIVREELDTVPQQSAEASPAMFDGRLIGPDGQSRTLSSAADAWTVGPLNHRGLWRIVDAPSEREAAGSPDISPRTLKEIACNLVNRQESDLRVAAGKSDSMQSKSSGGAPWWWYLTLVGLCWTAAEWFLYQRRWIA